MFSLTDIAFGSKSPLTGPLSALYQSPFSTSSLRYPLDVGSYDKGHYMLFHINVQKKTSFEGIEKFDTMDAINMAMNNDIISSIKGQLSAPKALGDMVGEVQSAFGSIVESATNAVNKGLKAINDAANSIKGGINDLTSKLGLGNLGIGKALDKFSLGLMTASNEPVNTSPLRTTKRTETSIALYMPDTLVFNYSHNFETPSMSEALGNAGKLAQAGGSLYEGLKNAAPGEKLKSGAENMKPFAVEAGSALAGAGAAAMGGNADATKKILMASQGVVTNPQLEVIYSTTALRTFSFEFMFYPRSQAEAKQVMRIIEEFRFHAAPEIDTSSSGRYLIPPSEFDIEFHMNGAPNPNIPRISTCVLQTIDIDFAPNGWSAYEVPGQVRGVTGGSGTPTAIRMNLTFQETQMITKEMIRANYRTQGGARSIAEMFSPSDRRNDGGY